MAPIILRMFDKDDIPSNPEGVLCTHVVLKGFQAGSVLGLLFSPLYWVTKRGGSHRGKSLLIKCMRSSMYGSAIGAGLTSLMLAQKFHSFSGMTKEEKKWAVLDRAYRIKFNQTQERNDLFSLTSAALATAVAYPLSLPILPATCSGLALGCLIHTATLPNVNKNEDWAAKKAAWKESYQKMK